MHEIGIVQNLIEQARRAAAGRRIRQVHVALGGLSDISAEALDFYFGQLRVETPLAEARLVIRAEPGRAECQNCEHVADGEAALLTCPVCAAVAWRIVGGNRVALEAVDVD